MRDVDIAIVGAGAAGLAAGRALSARNVSFAVLEASHRIGGRGHTEHFTPEVPFDLGCHWLHSASLNPFVEIADSLGISYLRNGGFRRHVLRKGKPISNAEQEDLDRFWAAQEEGMERGTAGPDRSLYDVTERGNRWTSHFDYIMSLISSADVDQISVEDLLSYNDTGEDWPVKHGYGTLIQRFGANVPVTLNAVVREIDWRGPRVRLATSKGDLHADKVLITVSTGVLAAGDISFLPALPHWKSEAIANLPLGNHNRIALLLDDNAIGDEIPRGRFLCDDEEEPFCFQIKPFGFPYVVGMTGGRFADWLERSGHKASVDYAVERLAGMFGSAIREQVRNHKVTAWRGDSWVKGSYSCALPGQSHQRKALARPIDEKLFFAGEATSQEFFSTAHGAYLSGDRAVEEMLPMMDRTGDAYKKA